MSQAALPGERRRGLFDASALSEGHARQRMKQRKVAPVSGGVEGWSSLCDVLANDGRIADLLVAVS